MRDQVIILRPHRLERPAAPSPALRPAFLLRHELLDRSDNHATARDIEQLAQMLDGVRPDWRSPQDRGDAETRRTDSGRVITEKVINLFSQR
jgi:hypothetical protein